MSGLFHSVGGGRRLLPIEAVRRADCRATIGDHLFGQFKAFSGRKLPLIANPWPLKINKSSSDAKTL